MKPTNCDLQVDIISDYLKGKTIALCVCGGIAAIEAPKIARMLRRHSASVKIYATESAFKFIGEVSLEWSTGHAVVSKLSGLAEHICEEDLVLVSPATLNTVNKVRYGIADSVVTTLIQSAMGQGKPILFCPTMHESLNRNPIYQESKHFLEAITQNSDSVNISFVEPRMEERKAKSPRVSTIAAKVCHALSDHPQKGKKVLVTAGSTFVPIDDVRGIKNIFTGKLGVTIAQYAYHKGMDVHLLIESSGVKAPEYVRSVKHKTYEQYKANVLETLQEFTFDYGIFSAAVADWRPAQVHKGKISSRNGGMPTAWEPTEKVIDIVQEAHPDLKMVTFKVESDITTDDLHEIARKRMQRGHYRVISNRLEDMADGKYTGYLYMPDHRLTINNKRDMSKNIIDTL